MNARSSAIHRKFMCLRHSARMGTRWWWFLVGCSALGARAAEQPLVVDYEHSRIEVVVRATLDSFIAQLKAYEPVIWVEDGNVARVRLQFHFQDLVTGKDGRDRAMHKWQQTEQYPDGSFELLSLRKSAGGAAVAKGKLTLHGVSREVEFPIHINRDGSRYAIDGDASIDTHEFGLPAIRLLGVLKVDPVVHVRFHLQGAPLLTVARRP